MKHNKKRNTAFAYEVLTRELTKAIVDQNALRKDKVIKILKEHFSSRTILGQELRLYQAILETKNIDLKIAERLLIETKAAHSRLNEKELFTAQSKLIAAVNKGVSKEVWGTFVPNFKSLASINSIFNRSTPVKKKVLFEQSLIDNMSAKQSSDNSSGDLRALDNLAYNSFIKKFNSKYNGLLAEQKEFLNHYITSFADDGFELRLYLNEELSRLTALLNKAATTKHPEAILRKTEETVCYLEGFRKRDFTEGDLNKILLTQELTQELFSND
tara:strand:+ start:2750 stop:3565 length:816 start_codon:yes stop_codon:yes gene_type:complete